MRIKHSCERWGYGRRISQVYPFGAAIGMRLAAKHPDMVASLSLHSGWSKTDPFLRTVIEGFQVMANAMGSVPEMVILALFPWCLTPELLPPSQITSSHWRPLCEADRRSLWRVSSSSRVL